MLGFRDFYRCLDVDLRDIDHLFEGKLSVL